MTVTVLAENTVAEGGAGLRPEHGLSLHIGLGHASILYDAVRARFPGTPIKAVLGGFHLVGIPGMNVLAEDEESVRQIGRMLLDRGIGRTYTGHCTGARAFRTLKTVMGSAVDCLATGSRIEI
jgi:7,8-dihydropterin-6-yl-methyl-4-(beta-D-ribofuranosyl)aminobenzene 5'-phosphate synthase